MSNARASRWCFTLNNYTADEVKWIDSADCTYVVYGKEVGESNTPHLQGYIEVATKRVMKTIKKMVGSRAHLEIARGTAKQASDYCKKDGAFTERGVMSVGSGHRTDLDDIGRDILSGTSVEDIASSDPGMYVKYHRGLQALANTIPSKKWRDVKVLVYWGPTGSGKTRSAMALEGGDVFKMNTNTNGTLWFDGYRGEKVLLLDDYYGWIKHGELLTLLDGYPYRCQVKGSFTWAQWTTVVITSNKEPKDWYAQGLNPALERRLTNIRHFYKISMELQLYKSGTFSIKRPEVGGNTIPPPIAFEKISKVLRIMRVYERSYYGQCSSQ